MLNNFQITGIAYTQFEYLFELNPNQLQKIGAVKLIVDQNPGFPCRVSLEDAEIGEEVVLFPYEHHKVTSPYQSRGPIFIRKNAKTAQLKPNEIPPILEHRLLSLRVYNEEGMMIDAKTIQGAIIKEVIKEIFENSLVAYIQVHNASPGCYNCQIDRVRE